MSLLASLLQGWREYVEEPGQPLVNPVVVPSGCAEHANIYAVYAVDSRQASWLLTGARKAETDDPLQFVCSENVSRFINRRK